MSKGKTIAITVTVVIVVLAAALFVVAANTNMLLSGDYYVKVDNTHVTKNEDTGGVVHLKSGEPYVYNLEAVNASGDKADIEFGTSRELRQDAYLKLELQPVRGVVNWTEVTQDALPSKVAQILN